MDNEKLAELLFPDIKNTPDYYENKYPQRELPPKAEVTRIGPSPTGFIHLGNLYSAMAGERLAHRSGGVFYLRIEDTDNKRKVDGAVESVISSLDYFGIKFDEGAEVQTQSSGISYGPFYQRQRAEVYQTYVKDLVKQGLAYPCFCSEEEIDAMRKRQTENKLDIGYYGEWAKCRNLTFEEIEKKIISGEPYSMRLRSEGQPGNTVKFNDEIMGEIILPENMLDIVILKSDGIPTYHFAHAVDDHLMRTTTVIRGCEWLPSVPVHIELFSVLGFRRPRYAHTAQLMKIEDGKKRKLSKRKDPELSLGYYRELGYHPEAVRIYLMTILNSNFEEWYQKNPALPLEEFKFSLNKMGVSGILFDLLKLDDISSNILSGKERDEVYKFFYDWMVQYKPECVDIYFGDSEKMKKITVFITFLLSGFIFMSVSSLGQSAKDFCKTGNDKYKKKEYAEAINDFTKAIEIKPNYARAYYFRGLARDELLDYMGSIADYTQVIDKSPGFTNAYFKRGDAKIKTQDYIGAIADFTEVIKVKNMYSEAYFRRGVAKDLLQDYHGAIADFSEAIKNNPNNVDFYFYRGDSRSKIRDYTSAIEDYTMVLEFNKNSSKAYYSRGLAKIFSGQRAAGCLDLSKAGELGMKEAYDTIKQFCY